MKVLCAVGTRPEAVKMAPLINKLAAQPWAEVRVLATAQHRELMDAVLQHFGIVPDIDLNVMRHNQSLPALTAMLIERIDQVLDKEQPDIVLAQGDTTTVFTVALASFYRKILFGHVEAGLRSFDLDNPYPEEMNRILAGRLSQLHFCPTHTARDNLLREGVDVQGIAVTGNTVIDALKEVAEHVDFNHAGLAPGKRTILVTAHRRENFGAPFERICTAINQITERFPDVQVLYPVHPNPNVREKANGFLEHNRSVVLCEPLNYFEFIGAMKRSYLILTDSGGVQEEAPALAKPVLVLRETTERPEAVDEGVVKLVGTQVESIVDEVSQLLSDEMAYGSMARGVSPYGDGLASDRIVSIIKNVWEARVR